MRWTYVVAETNGSQGNVGEVEGLNKSPILESAEHECTETDISGQDDDDSAEWDATFHTIPNVTLVICIVFLEIVVVVVAEFGISWTVRFRPCRIDWCRARVIDTVWTLRFAAARLVLATSTAACVDATRAAEAVQ